METIPAFFIVIVIFIACLLGASHRASRILFPVNPHISLIKDVPV